MAEELRSDTPGSASAIDISHLRTVCCMHTPRAQILTSGVVSAVIWAFSSSCLQCFYCAANTSLYHRRVWFPKVRARKFRNTSLQLLGFLTLGNIAIGSPCSSGLSLSPVRALGAKHTVSAEARLVRRRNKLRRYGSLRKKV
jgi:hypothetical protein